MKLDMNYFKELMESEYLVKEEDNFHIKKDAPDKIVKLMKEFRKLTYNDDNIYGESVKKSFSDTIHELIKDFSK